MARVRNQRLLKKHTRNTWADSSEAARRRISIARKSNYRTFKKRDVSEVHEVLDSIK